MVFKKNQGFSLVELMIAIVILAILITVGIPSFSATLLRLKASATADALASALHFARSSAISMNAKVSLCALAANEVPKPQCDNAATDWNRGWIVIDGDDTVLKYWRMDNDESIQLLIGAIAHDEKQVRFNAQGEASLFDGAAPISGTLQFESSVMGCANPQLNAGRNITVRPAGSIQVTAGQPCS
jgi:type IV fimbrial biogenesis protein FimT